MGAGFNKRGNMIDLILSPMFVVIIVLTLVFLPLLKYATSVGKSAYFEREFYSKDLGLMVSALQAAPNDVTVNYENVRNVNVTFKPNYIESYGYDVNPKNSPSKVTRFHIFPSSVSVIETLISPIVITDEKGYQSVLPYTIRLNKNQKEIIASSSNGFSSQLPKKDIVDVAVDKFISALYEQKNIYIDVAYGNGKSIDGVDANVFGKTICNAAVSGTYFSRVDKCNMDKSANIEERIKLAERADFIVIIYVNQESDDSLKIYYYEGVGPNVETSKKVAEQAIKIFENNGIVLSRDDISHLNSNEDIKKILLQNKPGFVIEIGDIEKLETNSIYVIGESIKNALLVISK